MTGVVRVARPVKVAVVDEVREEFGASAATLFTDYRGLTVSDLADLRARLRETGARYLVVKNTLARIAARDAGFDGLDELLTGPTAVTFCGDDPVTPAKTLRAFSREHPELVIKGGILEGRVLDAATAQRLADLESREELLARLAGLMYAVLATPARLLQAPLAQMARVIAALEDKGGASGGAETAPEAARGDAEQTEHSPTDTRPQA
ncbi:MAG: 50S ribosomal protein L10 [Actinomycetota bacterium]|nr:50S ribosomal protein L10 [Actinomycetota bacterium]